MKGHESVEKEMKYRKKESKQQWLQLTLIINVSSTIFHSQHLMFSSSSSYGKEKEMKVGSHEKRGQQKRGNHVSGKMYWKEEKMRKKRVKEEGRRKRITVNLHLESFFHSLFSGFSSFLMASLLVLFMFSLVLSIRILQDKLSCFRLLQATSMPSYFDAELLRCFEAVVPTSNFILHDPRLSCHVGKEEG